MAKHYFISDVHLGFFDRKRDRDREDLLIEFLSAIKGDAKTLFLLGDIFDFWFEYDTVVPAYFYRTLAKLSELRDAGVNIIYIMGNHDFGHKSFFQEELGIEVIRTDYETTLEGKKIYLSHGDGKSHSDKGYLLLKKLLRSNWANYLFRKLHPDWGIKFASGSSHKSRSYTDQKDYGDSDGIKEFALKKIDEGYDFVLMGHKHELIDISQKQGRYINLGEWIGGNPHFALLEDGNMSLLNVKEFLSQKKGNSINA